jgi:hypothetical protein
MQDDVAPWLTAIDCVIGKSAPWRGYREAQPRMLPLYYVKFMLLDESCTLLGRVEAEQGKKLFIKWHRQGHVLHSDLDVINKRFHGISGSGPLIYA